MNKTLSKTLAVLTGLWLTFGQQTMAESLDRVVAVVNQDVVGYRHDELLQVAQVCRHTKLLLGFWIPEDKLPETEIPEDVFLQVDGQAFGILEEKAGPEFTGVFFVRKVG